MPANPWKSSTNWKPGWLDSKLATMTMDRARVASVVQSAIHLELRAIEASPARPPNQRRIRMAATPISGAKVVRLRMPVMRRSPSPRPGPEGVAQQSRNPQQHDERVVIDVAGLDLPQPAPRHG